MPESEDGASPDQALILPSVVAVVVTHDSGPALEDCLSSLRDQDYEALSVLVIDAASETDPTARIAAVLPSAYVRRLETNPGYGPATNDVLEVVQGASFFLLCHDDVSLSATALRTMVEEAFRSNAGIVSPKLVEWDDSRLLLDVGQSADKTGVPVHFVEPGELDQEQHDAVRDVLAAPGGCMLVRADLFAALGGFDPAIELLGEDLDLSWRAQVAGARVIVAPDAVVRHQRKLGERIPVETFRRLQARHRLRTMLTCYGPLHLARVLPQAMLVALVEVVYALVAGRVSHAREIAGAWMWNLARLPEIRANRRRLRRVRQETDAEVRRLQVHGFARMNAFVRGQIGRQGDDRIRSMRSSGRHFAAELRTDSLRTELAVLGGLVLVILVGSRGLLSGSLPVFGDLPAFPARPWSLFADWASGFRSVGLGSDAPAPTALAMLGATGTILLGSMNLLRRVLFVGLLPTGALGAWRFGGALGSRRARILLLLAFMSNPLPYNAIAAGRWGGLAAWAAAPWIVHSLVRSLGTEPFASLRVSPRRRTLGLGIALAVVAALVSFEPVAVLVIGAGLALGGIVSADRAGTGRVLAVAAGAAGVAFVLHLPWTLDLILPGTQWSAVGGVRSLATALDVGHLLRFETGPIGGTPIGWAFVGAAVLPLLIGRDWRFDWASRSWMLALTCWSAAWLGQQPWFHFGLGPPEALLAPAAAALSLSIALGLIAFEVDLPGYRFGWRQVASVAAAVFVASGTLPVIAAAVGGRWNSPSAGVDSVLGFLRDERSALGPFRVLWVGDPAVMPTSGWQLRDGIAYATTDGGVPSLHERWAGSADGNTSLLADALRLADRQETARLGRLLAPFGVRYVILVDAASPAGGAVLNAPPDLVRGLDGQLDLERVSVDPSLKVYRNAGWAPSRFQISSDRAAPFASSSYFPAANALDLAGAPTALPQGHGPTRFTGEIGDRTYVYLSAASSGGWSLTVNGRTVPRTKALGWANGWTVEQGGRATLAYSTPALRWVLLAIQIALWGFAISRLVRLRSLERLERP